MTVGDARFVNSGPGSSLPLRIVLTSVRFRRELLRKIIEQFPGMAVDRLASVFSISTATAYRDLAVHRQPKHDRDSMLEAGLVWLLRYCTLPSSEDWNSTLARDQSRGGAESAGGEAWTRWLSGYCPQAEPAVPRRWPATARVTQVFDSFAAFRADVSRMRRELESKGTPYRAIPLPVSHLTLCQLRGMFDPPPPEVARAPPSTSYTESVSGVLTLLHLAGELEMHDAYARAAADPEATEFRWPP